MPVIETVRFAVRKGVSSKELQQAWTQSLAFTGKRPGFRGRSLAEDGNGGFADIVEWDSMEDAKAAAAAFDPGAVPDLRPLAEVIDETSVEMTHYVVKAVA